MPRGGRLKSVLKTGLRILIVTMVLLLGLEIIVRISASEESDIHRPFFAGGNHERFLVEFDATKHYRLKPGFRGRDRHPDFDVAVFINDEGFRDRPRDGLDEEARRILGVGDSFTYGEGVELEQTYLSRLESRLEQAGRVDVIKAGVPGYGPSQMVRMALERLEKDRPETVVMGLFYSDIARDEDPFIEKEGFLVRSSFAERLTLVAGNLWLSPQQNPVLAWLHVRMMGYSYLARWVTKLSVEAKTDTRKKTPPKIDRPADDVLAKLVEEKTASVRAGLRAFPGVCRSQRETSRALDSGKTRELGRSSQQSRCGQRACSMVEG